MPQRRSRGERAQTNRCHLHTQLCGILSARITGRRNNGDMVDGSWVATAPLSHYRGPVRGSQVGLFLAPTDRGAYRTRRSGTPPRPGAGGVTAAGSPDVDSISGQRVKMSFLTDAEKLRFLLNSFKYNQKHGGAPKRPSDAG